MTSQLRFVMSDVEWVILAVGQSLPAGGTGVWWCQSISQTLAAEHVTTFGGNNQSSALHDLQRQINQSGEMILLAAQVCTRSDWVSPLSTSPYRRDSWSSPELSWNTIWRDQSTHWSLGTTVHLHCVWLEGSLKDSNWMIRGNWIFWTWFKGDISRIPSRTWRSHWPA